VQAPHQPRRADQGTAAALYASGPAVTRSHPVAPYGQYLITEPALIVAGDVLTASSGLATATILTGGAIVGFSALAAARRDKRR